MQNEREVLSFKGRGENLQLTMLPLSRVEYRSRSLEGFKWHREPDAVGFNADRSIVAVWSSYEAADNKLVTTHSESGEAISAVELQGAITPRFVQSLPHDRVLLVHSRCSQARPLNAQVWDRNGSMEAAMDLDDAIEHAVAMPDGSFWVGYFDEKSGSHFPGAHGLVRFNPDFTVSWAYPFDQSLPDQFDCVALNVSGSTAWTCSYTSYRLASVDGEIVTDHGSAPHQGGRGLLIDHESGRGALLGGYGPDYDLVVPFCMTPDGVIAAGKRGRVVLPDGLELQRRPWTCREGTARLNIGSALYEITLSTIFGALA